MPDNPPDKDPLEKFLDEVEKTLEMMEKRKAKLIADLEMRDDEKLPLEIQKKLAELNEAVKVFLKLNKTFLPTTLEGRTEIHQALMHPETQPDNARKIIERAQALAYQADNAQKDLIMSSSKARSKKATRLKDKSSAKARRKKFRNIEKGDRRI